MRGKGCRTLFKKLQPIEVGAVGDLLGSEPFFGEGL
jgi:hypothetical protein